MNEKYLNTLKNRSEFYPHKLEEQFPRIFEQIMAFWSSPEFDSLLNKLMLDKRDNPRHGFPPDIASEILRLSILHSEQYKTISSNSWIDASDIRID